MESNNDKSKISLNRKMRLWNRYRNYVIGLVVIVVLVVIFAIVLRTAVIRRIMIIIKKLLHL